MHPSLGSPFFGRQKKSVGGIVFSRGAESPGGKKKLPVNA
jgi:hypothetical protein